jgi:hypothetical protein
MKMMITKDRRNSSANNDNLPWKLPKEKLIV